MYLKNLDVFLEALQIEKTLIKLTVNVTDKEVTVVPNMYVTYNDIIRNVSKCLTWSKFLPVWQDKSCVHCPTRGDKWETDYAEKTLYEDIINNTDIREKIEIIRKNAHNLMVEVNKYLKKYVLFRGRKLYVLICS